MPVRLDPVVARPGVLATGLLLVVALVARADGQAATSSTGRAMPTRLAPQSLLLDVAVSGGRWVAVGERGHVIVSTDDGATWTQGDVPTRALLTGVAMHDDTLGWAVGHDEVILRTRDGGLTWERVHYAPENERPLLDVWFADDRRGVAVGAYGTLLATTDGGSTWEARTVGDGIDFHLNQITKAPDGALYIAAEAGHLYRSDNEGATWTALTSPYQGSFFGVLPLPDGRVLAYALRGNLFASPDKGTTWQKVETSSEETLTCAAQLGGGRFVVGGMAGTLLWGDSQGVRLEERPERKAIAAVAPTGDGAVLSFGEGGVHRIAIAR